MRTEEKIILRNGTIGVNQEDWLLRTNKTVPINPAKKRTQETQMV